MSTAIEPQVGSPQPDKTFCFHCGQAMPGGGQCSHCGAKVAVEIVVPKIADAKLAYHAARLLNQLDAPTAGAVGDLTKKLQLGQVRIVTDRSWGECEKVVERLSEAQVSASLGVVTFPPRSSRLPQQVRRPAVIVTAGILVVFLLVIVLRPGKPLTSPANEPLRPALVGETVAVDEESVGASSEETVDAEEQEAAAPTTPKSEARFSFEAIGRSIVLLRAGPSQGTGFVVKGGFILTNEHVLGGLAAGASVEVEFVDADGQTRTAQARVYQASKRLDMAVIQCGGDCEQLPALTLGKSTNVESGATVFALGNPLGLSLTLSRGIVSHTHRELGGVLFLQSDVQVNPGNSGGPLFDETGAVLGIVTAKASAAEGISFILPIEYATQGDNAVLDGVLGQASEFSSSFVTRLEKAGINIGSEREYAQTSEAAEAAPAEQIILDSAAISNENAYYVKFRTLVVQTSQLPPNGPFYIVIEQKNPPYRGTFQMTGLPKPVKLGEKEGGVAEWGFEHVSRFVGVQKFSPGDQVTLRMRDDLFSNSALLVGR